MIIDKYKTENGYKDEDGITYVSAEEWFLTKEFGFCGCGKSEDALKFIMNGLRHIDIPYDIDNHDIWFRMWKDNEKKVFGGDGAAYFFFYWADKEGLTDHGSSVPGWLTRRGKEILQDLEEIFKDD